MLLNNIWTCNKKIKKIFKIFFTAEYVVEIFELHRYLLRNQISTMEL